MQEELLDLLYDSKNHFIVEVFAESKAERDKASKEDSLNSPTSSPKGLGVALVKNATIKKANKPTVAMKFKVL